MSSPRTLFFVTHPDVLIDPSIPVPEWSLSARGQARMQSLLAQPWIGGVRSLWCSTERKARDAAEIVARPLGLSVAEWAPLGENDRTATGYLPGPVFEAVADRFFAQPEQSVRGWERAADAQRRIVAAIEHVLSVSNACGDVAVLSHGAVGALLLCHLSGEAISRRRDQPAGQGGQFFAFDIETRALRHDWRRIDA